jgi:hypothetical protein
MIAAEGPLESSVIGRFTSSTPDHDQRITDFIEDHSVSQTLSELRGVARSAEKLAAIISQMRTSAPLQDKPLFLRLPREIRDHTYGYILTLDRGPEYIHPLDERQTDKEILGLLGVNHQVSDEARKVLERTNLWICFTVDLSDCQSTQLRQVVDFAAESGCKLQIYPLKCGTGPLRALKERAVLSITIRPLSQDSAPTTAYDDQDLTTTIVFA